MIVYSAYQASDSHSCVELWNSDPLLGSLFPIDLRLWRQNVEQSTHTIKGACLIARDEEHPYQAMGLIVCKSPRNLSAIVVSPNYRRHSIATELFRRAGAAIGAASDQKWIAGQDYNHFFPGVPEQATDATAFLEKMGFARGSDFIYDLHRPLGDYSISQPVLEKIAELQSQGIELGTCRQEDLSPLIDHVSKNFSQRWLAETINRLNVETVPDEIIVARRPETSEVIGFAHTFSNRSRYIGPSIYWRPLLGPKYGGLGPIGVATDVRKIGLGLALLSYAIQSVKDRGATEMAIDWTVLVDFYAKVGFTPWKRYIAMRQP